MQPTGLYVPITSPFTAGGELDQGAFEHNVGALIHAGVDGIAVAGTTGEAALLDEREREQLVEWARAIVPKDRLLIAGIGAESTRATVRYARRAAERGANAALVVAPHYFHTAMSEQALGAHYRRVADDSPIPIILYNIPKYMHFRLSGSLVSELAAHENVIGIKDSSGDRNSLVEYLAFQGDRFTVLTGSGPFFRSALVLGARGAILALANFAADLALSILNASRLGAPDADSLQERLTPAAKIIVNEMGIPAIKRAMDLVGMRGGAPRSPLLPVSPADAERIRDVLRAAELTVAV